MSNATIVIYICTGLLALLTLAPLTRVSHWLVRDLDFPRLQLAFLALVNLAACGIFSMRHPSQSTQFIGAALITVLILLYHGWWIFPYSRLHRKEVTSYSGRNSNTVSMLVSNVFMDNPHADALLRLVGQREPDLLLTLETDDRWQEQLKILESGYPYRVACPKSNYYGMHLYSKLEIMECHVEYLVEKDIPSLHLVLRLNSGCEIAVHCLHPTPPSPTENSSSGPRDAELIVVAKKVAGSEKPVIVMGDLNDAAWSKSTRLFRRISGLLDPRIGRGMYNTFHAQHWYLRWPLDHLFHSTHFHLNTMQRLYLKGSDHFALYTQLTLTDRAEVNVATEHADAEDRERAKEIIKAEAADEGDVPTL